MTKQELHKDFGNWIHEKGYRQVPHKVDIYYDGDYGVHIDVIKEKYLSHLENLLQDYE